MVLSKEANKTKVATLDKTNKGKKNEAEMNQINKQNKSLKGQRSQQKFGKKIWHQKAK